eukprot:4570866-Prymnesium_polylepis.1
MNSRKEPGNERGGGETDPSKRALASSRGLPWSDTQCRTATSLIRSRPTEAKPRGAIRGVPAAR